MPPAARQCCLALLLALCLYPFAQARQADADTSLLLEVRLRQHQLAEAITAWPVDGDLALPLGELARLLTLAIKTDPAAGTASGYLLDESHPFSLDARTGELLIDGRREQISPALLRREGDDLYVPRRLLSRWLPVDLQLDLSALVLEVQPRLRLPLEAALARRARMPAAAGARPDPGYPRLDLPYRLASAPFVDQSLGIDAQRERAHGQASALTYSAYATADLLGMQAAMFASLRRQRSSDVGVNADITAASLRMTLGRQDDAGNLLGAMHARTALLGNVPVAAVDHISHTATAGYGVLVSNHVLGQPFGFERQSLDGELPQGWDVELFYNGALIAMQQTGADGRYHFDELPLAYGSNEFRLVFHGPLGQLRSERRSVLLDQSALAPGTLSYLAALQRDTNHDGRLRALARFDAGINRHLSASAALVRLPADALAAPMSYLDVGLHAWWANLAGGASLIRASDGGQLGELSFKTRLDGWSLGASHAVLDHFSSDIYRPVADPVKGRDEVRIDGVPGIGNTAPADAAPIPALLFPVSFQLRRDTLVSQRQLLDAQLRLAYFRQGTALSNQLRWQSQPGQRAVDGIFSLSRRVAGYGLSGQLQYTVLPRRALSSVSLNADTSLGAGALATAGVTRDLGGAGGYRVSAGYNRSIGAGRLALGASAFYSSRGDAAKGVGVGLRLFTAAGFEPRQGSWHASAQPMAAAGAAAVRVYLDRNGNGVFDAGDTPIEQAALLINGARQPVRTGPDGIALLERLPPNLPVDLAVDGDTLSDPQWSAAGKGVRLVARPGVVAVIDLAVAVSGEVEGQIWLPGPGRRPAAGVTVQLLAADGKIAASTVSGIEGDYLFPTVPAGAWRLRAAGGAGSAERALRMGLDGAALTAQDLVLARAASLPPGLP